MTRGPSFESKVDYLLIIMSWSLIQRQSRLYNNVKHIVYENQETCQINIKNVFGKFQRKINNWITLTKKHVQVFILGFPNFLIVYEAIIHHVPRSYYPRFIGEFRKISKNQDKRERERALQTGKWFALQEIPYLRYKSRHSNFPPQDLVLAVGWKNMFWPHCAE